MTKSGWIRLACAALFVFVLTRLMLAYDALPARIAGHFDGSGRPGNFMPKEQVVRHLLVLQLLAPAFLLSMQQLVRMSKGKVNVPHAWYYLAPERRDASIARLRSFLDEPALATALLLATLSELSVRAYQSGGSMSLPSIPMALFGVFLLAWVVRIFRAFPHPPSP
ncbi:MAG: DUF1648 domain-containing protein [Polyangiales bacterium]